MQVLREIRNVTTPTITITLPEAFRRQAIEIIVLPASDSLSSSPKTSSSWPKRFIERFSGCLPDFPDIDSEGPYESREIFL